jgi:hypothetical protein
LTKGLSMSGDSCRKVSSNRYRTPQTPWLQRWIHLPPKKSCRKSIVMWRPMLRTSSRSDSRRLALPHISTRSSSRWLQAFLCCSLLKLCLLCVSYSKFLNILLIQSRLSCRCSFGVLSSITLSRIHYVRLSSNRY